MRVLQRGVRGRPDSALLSADDNGSLGPGLELLILFLAGAGDGGHTSVCT